MQEQHARQENCTCQILQDEESLQRYLCLYVGRLQQLHGRHSPKELLPVRSTQSSPETPGRSQTSDTFCNTYPVPPDSSRTPLGCWGQDREVSYLVLP